MKKNVSGQKIGAQMVSATDGSAFTGSVTVYVTGDGGTQAAGSVGSGACTHEGNGYHTYAPAQAETNYDLTAFTFIGTGAVPVTIQVFNSFPQTGDSYARLGAPAGASVSADIATIDGVVDSILVDTAEIGAAGAGLTAVPWNASWDAEVQSECADALTAYDPPTKTEMDSGFAALNDIAATDIVSNGAITTLAGAVVNVDLVDVCTTNTDMRGTDSAYTGTPPTAGAIADAVWDEATTGHSTAGTAGKAITDILADTNELQADDYPATLATLATAASISALNDIDAAGVRAAVGMASANLDTQLGALPTAAENADAVWEEAVADHSGTSGSTAESLAAAGGSGDPWVTSLPGSYTGTQAGKILADILTDTGTTIPGQLDDMSGATFDTATDSLEAIRNRGDSAWTGGGSAPTVSEIRIEMDTNSTQLAKLGTPAGASMSADIAAVKSDTGAILTDTAEIGTAGAGLTALASASALATVDSNVDAILVDTGTTIPASIDALPTAAENRAEMDSNSTKLAAIVADTGELQADWANGGRLDLLIDAIKVVTDALPDSGALTSLTAALATVDGNVDAILVDTDTTIPGLLAALNDLSAGDILTTQLVESYAADGTAPTLSEAIFLIQQFLYERATSGTTVTVKKLDSSTTAATLTLDDDTAPTSITRAS